MIENQTFRVALVGCGAISKTHIAAILAAGQTVAALCDVEEEKARALAAGTGLLNVPIFTDFETMLDRVRPDVLHICTPHDLHAPMTVAALGRGIHVLCEKPLAITEEQLCAVLAAEQKSAAFLGVCQQNRYEPNMRKLKEMTEDDPPVGGYANVVWKRDAAYYASLGFRSITSFGCYLGPDYQRLYGNPPLKEYGSILRECARAYGGDGSAEEK